MNRATICAASYMKCVEEAGGDAWLEVECRLAFTDCLHNDTAFAECVEGLIAHIGKSGPAESDECRDRLRPGRGNRY